MKTGFDSVRAVRAWLDGIATLAVEAAEQHWRRNAYAALYLWYQRSKPGEFGKFMVAPDYAPPPVTDGWMPATQERLRWTLNRSQLWEQIRRALTSLPILDPSDMSAEPPAPRLEDAPPACKHNAMKERPADSRYAWECADCGYVYGRDDCVPQPGTSNARPQAGPLAAPEPAAMEREPWQEAQPSLWWPSRQQ